MGKFNEDVFEGAVEIVSASMEEAEVELSAKGGEQVGEYFSAIYKRLLAIAEGQDATGERQGSYEIYQDAKGEYRFRLKAGNGETIAVSEGYAKKEACLKGIESVRKNAFSAPVKEA